MWQKKFKELQNEGFTIVGLALDAEGIEPAKRYYDEFGVTFPALVDPNYATRFAAVPKTIFIDEHGVVLSHKGNDWEAKLADLPPLRPVTESIKKKWTDPGIRLKKSSMEELVARNQELPADLRIAAELGSRYISLNQHHLADAVLSEAATQLDPREVARGDKNTSRELARVYFQWSRAAVESREQQVERATTSFFLDPTVGFGKQIARIIAPEKFDGRPKGDFDKEFREATLRRLKAERKAWLTVGE